MSWLKKLFVAAAPGPRTLAHPGAWIYPGEVPLPEFLRHARPSTSVSRYLSSDLSTHQVPWFWIITKQEEAAQIVIDEETFVLEGETIVDQLTDACKLEDDPTRRMEIYDKFNEQVEELSMRTNIRSGKWLFKLPKQSIDSAFDRLALSLGEEGGLLAETSAHTIKVASTPKNDEWEMHVHCNESFDPAELRRMAELLVKELGVVPSGYECDANVLLSVDASHSSGIPSPRYKISDFISPASLKEALSRAN